jgi:hypothetical protein
VHLLCVVVVVVQWNSETAANNHGVIRVSDLRTKSEKNRFVRTRFPERDTSFSAPKTYTSKRKRRLQNTFLLLLLVFSSSSRERKRARVCVCLCIYIICVVVVKKKSGDAWDPHVCRFLPANEKKISRFSVWRPL